jgi:hypothetical protein
LLTVATLSGQPAREAPRVLSYGALGQQVRGLKGKVVVVYFWSFG